VGTRLIDTGPSSAGWHGTETWLRCVTLYGWSQLGETAGISEEALARGTLVHVALAHLFERARLGHDCFEAEGYAAPREALCLAADKLGAIGAEVLPIASRAVKAYLAQWGHERPRVLAVERELETVFEVPGFPPARYTARADRITEDAAGLVWIWDIKTAHRLEAKVSARYVLSGQILGLAHLGARIYGKRFGGVRLDLVGCEDLRCERVTPDPAPWMYRKFPRVIAAARAGMAAFDAARAPPEEWPASPSEVTCFTPYGRCRAWARCRFGAEGR